MDRGSLLSFWGSCCSGSQSPYLFFRILMSRLLCNSARKESQARPRLNMGVLTQLFYLLLFWHPAASTNTTLTQFPAYLSVSLKESISIICKASQSVSDYVTWYQQKPGQSPKIIIYDADNRYSGVPDRFTGIQSGTEFIFKISSVEAEDTANYYCQQDYSLPPTVLQPLTETILLASWV
ncbi:Ig kappa chain V19-17 [Tupaia chinensis]|uniref:Ig kappa chain V19-17 n=1 Tax=Tupaia chinensis TaxID=246437 RepID=L9JLY1_TUPCH|nr:Ig kappa chain V19-17 [Tupaia chinensis]